LLGGIIVLFFGYGIWLDAWLQDVSLGPTIERTNEGSTNAIILLMFVLPGLLVALGSYLQTIYYKTWALVLVGIGGIAAATFVGIKRAFSVRLYWIKMGRPRRNHGFGFNRLNVGTRNYERHRLETSNGKTGFLNDVSNKSLDASGGGVFRIIIGPTMVE